MLAAIAAGVPAAAPTVTEIETPVPLVPSAESYQVSYTLVTGSQTPEFTFPRLNTGHQVANLYIGGDYYGSPQTKIGHTDRDGKFVPC